MNRVNALVIDTQIAASHGGGGPRSDHLPKPPQSLSAHIATLLKLDRLLLIVQRKTRLLGRRSRNSPTSTSTTTSASTSHPPSPFPPTSLPLTPTTPLTPSTLTAAPWLATPEVERAAFFMYLVQLQSQISTLETAVRRLEEHLEKVASGLSVLERLSRREIRQILAAPARQAPPSQSQEGELGGLERHAVVKEWLRDLDRAVPEDEDEEEGEKEGETSPAAAAAGVAGDADDDDSEPPPKAGTNPWAARIHWERTVFQESMHGGFAWVHEKLVRAQGGVKAAEAKLAKLLDSGVVEDTLFPGLRGLFVGGEEDALLGGRGRGARVAVVECRGETERLGVWIGGLRGRFLAFSLDGEGDGDGGREREGQEGEGEGEW